MIPDSYIPKFWTKVAKGDGCWEWLGFHTEKGYGAIQISEGGKKRHLRAHRISYFLSTGDDPGEMQIDHTCYNKGCVNPAHLRLVTNKQNQENRPGAQRNNNSTGVRGVYITREGKFHARVKHQQRALNFGYYDTLEEARDAVIAARLKLFTHNIVDQRERIPIDNKHQIGSLKQPTQAAFSLPEN